MTVSIDQSTLTHDNSGSLAAKYFNINFSGSYDRVNGELFDGKDVGLSAIKSLTFIATSSGGASNSGVYLYTTQIPTALSQTAAIRIYQQGAYPNVEGTVYHNAASVGSDMFFNFDEAGDPYLVANMTDTADHYLTWTDPNDPSNKDIVQIKHDVGAAGYYGILCIRDGSEASSSDILTVDPGSLPPYTGEDILIKLQNGGILKIGSTPVIESGILTFDATTERLEADFTASGGQDRTISSDPDKSYIVRSSTLNELRNGDDLTGVTVRCLALGY